MTIRSGVGSRIRPWGQQPQRDLDAIIHWRVDVLRTIDRLHDLSECLKAIECEMRDENPCLDLIDTSYAIATQVNGKISALYKAMRKRAARQIDERKVLK